MPDLANKIPLPPGIHFQKWLLGTLVISHENSFTAPKVTLLVGFKKKKCFFPPPLYFNFATASGITVHGSFEDTCVEKTFYYKKDYTG